MWGGVIHSLTSVNGSHLSTTRHESVGLCHVRYPLFTSMKDTRTHEVRRFANLEFSWICWREWRRSPEGSLADYLRVRLGWIAWWRATTILCPSRTVEQLARFLSMMYCEIHDTSLAASQMNFVHLLSCSSWFIMENGSPIMGGVGWGGEGLKPIGNDEGWGGSPPSTYRRANPLAA